MATLAAAATGWTVVTYDQRGTSVVRHIWSRTLLWYHVCGNTPVRLVVVRDPTGRQPDDFFVTTNTEVVFRDTKQHLGGQDPQCWKRQGPQRVCYLSLWLSSAIWLWYLDVWGARPSWRATWEVRLCFYGASTPNVNDVRRYRNVRPAQHRGKLHELGIVVGLRGRYNLVDDPKLSATAGDRGGAHPATGRAPCAASV